MEQTKFVLTEKEMPTHWYNIQADLPQPLPPVLHPATGKPVIPDDLAPIFPMALIEQEMSTERWIEIPEEVQACLPHLETHSIASGVSAGESFRHTSKNLL
jgi:tryptophan synthase beta chain